MNRNTTDDVDEASVAFADLPAYEGSTDALDTAHALVGAILELRERLSVGALDADARYDIGQDILDYTERLHGFALTAL